MCLIELEEIDNGIVESESSVEAVFSHLIETFVDDAVEVTGKKGRYSFKVYNFKRK